MLSYTSLLVKSPTNVYIALRIDHGQCRSIFLGFSLSSLYVCYLVTFRDVKNTNRNPIQLPTTPIAEYELMNINGKNSYLAPNIS